MAVFNRRWFMWDLARQRRFDRKEFLMVVSKLSELGYNGLGLYLEGAFELGCGGGGILRKGVMTREDAAWAKKECEKLGIFLFPMTNVVGHMEHFLRQERFKHLCANLKQGSLDINFELPEAEDFALKIVHEYYEAFDTDYLHIGGDEAKLNDQNRPVYANFLSGLCDKLLAEGKKVAIWNDLLWEHQELVGPFSRDIEIFDWWYKGHRPMSIEFFRNAGFKNIIVCPCENSWVGFISHQFLRDWVKDPDQTPVDSDEIEAFLQDNVKVGDNENLCGLYTHWEDTMGRDLWGQWSPIARAGLFMQGKWEYKTRNDEALEKAIFGRITPYTEIMHIIQDEIHTLFRNPALVSYVRMALFTKKNFNDAAIDSVNTGRNFMPEVEAAISKIDALLGGWNPENEFEACCKAELVSVSAMMKASFALKSAFADCGKLYTEAAKLQFTDPEKAKSLVLEFAEGFAFAAKLNREYYDALKKLIDLTAHTETDLIKLDSTYKYTTDFAETVKKLTEEESFSKIPLPTINFVLDFVLDDIVIEK